MSLTTKRTRFILVQSTSNANVTEDNMEPYHISVFRRSTSMPPLPKLSSSKKRGEEQQSSSSIVISKDESLTNKFYKLNIHTMKKKSARISMRLSSVFGLSSHTIDEEFNFQEQRFRSIEKFLKIFLRNIFICIEALRENFLTQIDVAEDFEELLIDKMPDLLQQFIRLKRSLLENAFIEFCNHIELYVIQTLNTLLKLFILPANLISKRYKKLLDYDSAQSSYEKVKDQQLKQAKQVLDLSKQTYDVLNNKLLEELPKLYDYSCDILFICLKEFLHAHYRLIQQMKINIQIIFNQIISSVNFEELNWQDIINRFNMKNNLTSEQIFQLTITAKNFSEKLKKLSITHMSSVMNNLYNSDKEIYIQTDDIRYLIKNRYPDKDLFTVIQDCINRSITVRNGDLVGIINGDNTDLTCFVDNGITRGYLPRSILRPFSSDLLPSTPPPRPIRHDIQVPSRVPVPLARGKPRTHNDQLENTVVNTNNELEISLNNSSQNDGIYLNQLECQSSIIEPEPTHQYASIDSESNEQEQIYIALYDFNCSIDGVLSLHVGEQLKILRRLDDDGNDEWWYVEKLNDTKQKGYVPANYIQPIQ